MTLDTRTPCPACPIVWRNLQRSAEVLVALIDLARGPAGYRINNRDLAEAVENVRIATQHCAPLVEAHEENQEHAMSVDLVDWRQGRPTPTTLVLDRALPFGGSSE